MRHIKRNTKLSLITWMCLYEFLLYYQNIGWDTQHTLHVSAVSPKKKHVNNYSFCMQLLILGELLFTKYVIR